MYYLCKSIDLVIVKTMMFLRFRFSEFYCSTAARIDQLNQGTGEHEHISMANTSCSGSGGTGAGKVTMKIYH